MKCCPNCKGALDSNGKCLACGTVTKLKLSAEDGQVLNEIPKGLVSAIQISKIKVYNQKTGELIMERDNPQLKITDENGVHFYNQPAVHLLDNKVEKITIDEFRPKE